MTVAKTVLKEPDFEELRKRKLTFKLFGLSITHSKAPLLHNSLFKKMNLDWKYELLDSNDVEAFKGHLRRDDCIGSAVTMPNKVTMTEHVDKVDEGAKAVGAINTIYVREDAATGDKLYLGTNTDVFGIRDALKYNAPVEVAKCQNERLPGLVYGGGGACRSAVYALHAYFKCSTIYIVNRFADEVEVVRESMVKNGFTGSIVHIATPEAAESLVVKPNLIVCTVPDFAPSTEEEKTAKATLDVFMNSPGKGAVLEMCYHPHPTTRLYKEFQAAGWNVVGGVEAMIYQGFAQQVLWTGYTLNDMPTKDVIELVYRDL